MKKTYNTPRCKFIDIECSELLANSNTETMGMGSGTAPKVMDSNSRSHDIWDE